MSTILFFGTPDIACPFLRALHEDPSFRITHVITQPSKPVGRKHVITPPPVALLANELKIPVLQPEKISLQELQGVERPDFFVTVAYGQKLSSELLAFPRIAPINVHFSLLPRWRGAAPVQSSLLAGDSETGVTIQRMAKEIDAGPILAMEKIAIAPRETCETLLRKLTALGVLLLLRTLAAPLIETPQDVSTTVLCKKLTRADGVANPSVMTAEDIDRRVRALTPWPGVSFSSSEEPSTSRFAAVRGDESRSKLHNVKILATSLVSHPDAYELPCAKSTILYMMKMQSPGKKAMTGAEWGRGYLR